MSEYYDYNYDPYGDSGSSFSSYSGGSPVIGGVKGFIGAFIGSIPGMLLLILLGKIGFIASATGILIAMGVVFGYTFMVKDNQVPGGVGVAICVAVFVIAIIIGVRVVWSWELADIFAEYLPEFRESIISYALAEDSELTRSEVESMLTDDVYRVLVKETFGIEKGTFGECFSNFGDLLDVFEVKGKFYFSLFKHLAFGALGGAGLFAKMGQSSSKF